jgi:hypothetical protein
MSTRNLPGGKGQPARKVVNLTAISEPNGSLNDSETYGLARLVTGIALHY